MKISNRVSKSIPKRHRRYLIPLALFALYSVGNHFIQNTGIDRLSMLSDSALVSVGRMRKPYGIGFWAFDSYIRACKKAQISPQRISQTIGYAKASAGFHAPDGVANEKNQRIAYTCALDISVRGLTTPQIRALLSALSEAGFVPFWRTGPKWVGNNHIHAVFVGYPMKAQLRRQVEDGFAGRDGLAGHRREIYFRLSASQIKALRLIYAKCSAGKVAPQSLGGVD